MTKRTYRLMDAAVDFVAPALFVVSAWQAYEGAMTSALLAAAWGIGTVVMFNRFELDQLRRGNSAVFRNQMTLAKIYERMADELEEQAVREPEQEEKTR